MNKVALGTILGAALLGFTKSRSGGKSSKSFSDTFKQDASGFDGLDSEWVSNSGPPQKALPELIIFSYLKPSNPDIKVWGTGDFNKALKKNKLAEEIVVNDIRNKGEPTFTNSRHVKHLFISGTFKELNPSKFIGLTKLESLTITSPNMEQIPNFLKDIPTLKRLRICAPIFDLSPLTDMKQLEYLKIDDNCDIDEEKYNYRRIRNVHETIKTLTSLEYLFLKGSNYFFEDSAGLECIGHLTKLKQLYVHQERTINMTSYVEGSSGGYSFLSACKDLEFLCLYNTEFHDYNNTISITEELGTLPKLKYLVLPYYNAGWLRQGYMTISSTNFPSLEYLYVNNVEKIIFDGRFKKMTQLYATKTKRYYKKNRYTSTSHAIREIVGLENLISLKKIKVEMSSWSGEQMMINDLLQLKGIESIDFTSDSVSYDLDLYNQKVSCRKLKELVITAQNSNVALPKDIKKCIDLEKIKIVHSKTLAFNKSLFDLPNLKSVAGSYFVLYNPRVSTDESNEHEKIKLMTTVPVEMMYDSNISFSGSETNIKVSDLRPEFAQKIFSQNTLSVQGFANNGKVEFQGIEIISDRYKADLYLQKVIPFRFFVEPDDWSYLQNTPIKIDHKSLKDLSQKKSSSWSNDIAPMGLVFSSPTPFVKLFIQPKYTSEPMVSLQQWKSTYLPQQQYYKGGHDKKYKENPRYIPYKTINFKQAFEKRYYFNPDIYLRPFAEDLKYLTMEKYPAFETIGDIKLPKLENLRLNFKGDMYNLPQDNLGETFVLLQSIFDAAPILESIYIMKSKLKKIPENIANLSNLQKLNIEYTDISDLPMSMSNNKKLHDLGINNNKFNMFPLVFSYLQFSVKRFNGRNNPLRDNKNLGQLYFMMLNKVQEALQNPNLTAYARNYIDDLRYRHKNILLQAVSELMRYPRITPERSNLRER